MKATRTTRLLAGAAGFAIAATFGSAVYAQSDSKPVSRGEVSEQARAANMAGQMPAGELSAADKQMPMASTKTREQNKAETLAANRNGSLGSPGQALYKANNVAPREALAHSTKTRAERKQETLQAARDHKLMPAGEANAMSL